MNSSRFWGYNSEENKYPALKELNTSWVRLAEIINTLFYMLKHR